MSECSTRQGLNSRATNIMPKLSTSGISLKTFSWSTLWQLCTQSMSSVRQTARLQVRNEHQHDCFLGICAGGAQCEGFPTKKNNDKRKGRKGKDEPDTLDPSVYPTMVFSSDVDPEIIISRVAHEFGCAGGFYFWKKQLQCKETMTPFIIYFLYTFNDITTLRGELTSLLEEALQGT